MFVVFAAAAVIWSLLVLRATLRRGGGRSIAVASSGAVAAAVVSIVIDVRAMQLARRAEPADVAIRIVARGDWFELAYEARGTAFITANELHVRGDERGRSEEHTSELQSHSFISYAVFCLK